MDGWEALYQSLLEGVRLQLLEEQTKIFVEILEALI